MKKTIVLTSFSLAVALPSACKDDAACANPAKGNALLQMRGLTNFKSAIVQEQHGPEQAGEIPGLTEDHTDPDPAQHPMVWLEVDSDVVTADVNTAIAPSNSSSTRDNPADRKEAKYLRKLFKDAIKQVNATEGQAAAQRLKQALGRLKEDGLAALEDPEVKEVAESVFQLISQEEEADQAQEDNHTLTLDDWLAIEGLNGTPELSNRSLCVEGDMCAWDEASLLLLQDRVAGGYRSAINLFPKDKPLKICVFPGTPSAAAKVFRLAAQQFKNLVPCKAMEFEEVEYVPGGDCRIIVSSLADDCSAVVGMVSANRPTPVNLGAGCRSVGIAAHELGHAIGMMHEHSRPDRDDYVAIHWDNIYPGMKGNFGKVSGDTQVPYDLGSLMHYSEKTFGKSGKKTISVKPGVERKVMGNRLGLSAADAKQVGLMYGCADSVNWKLCPTDTCTTDECICHQSQHDVRKGLFPIIKSTDANKCNRCVVHCADTGSRNCGCPAGCDPVQEGKLTKCVVSGTDKGCLASGEYAPKERKRRRRRRRRRKGGKQSLTSVRAKECKNLVEDEVCSKHSNTYCEYDGKVTISVKKAGIELDFATEACAKTCNKC